MLPANPNANLSVGQVMSYMAALPERTDKRTIVGQDARPLPRLEPGYKNFVKGLNELTGKWVALMGTTYGQDASASDIASGNPSLIDYWNLGGLITIRASLSNPWTGGRPDDLSHRNLVELITPGAQVNGAWMAELDKLAAGLAELRDAGVVVLWRPFPHMTLQDRFWWDAGAHPGDPEPFKNMWRHMFDYFTDEKGLDNLLWVYSAADTDSQLPVDRMYPGNSYVDVVGLTVYSDDLSVQGDPYARLEATGKPFALCEVGSAHGGQRDGSFDNLTIINEIVARYPKTVYFLCWHSWSNQKVAIVDNRNAGGLMNHAWAITRDDVNWKDFVPSDIIESLEQVEIDLRTRADELQVEAGRLRDIAASIESTLADLEELGFVKV